MTALGFNVHISYCTEDYLRLLVADFQRTQPGALLLLDTFGNKADYAIELSVKLPKTVIIYRRATPDNLQDHMGVEQWAQMNSMFKNTGVFVSTTNEPNPLRALPWLTQAVLVAKQNRIKIAVGAFSVGTPHEKDMVQALPLLRAMANYPGGAVLELHEYERALVTHAIAPQMKAPESWPNAVAGSMRFYRMGRFRNWIDLADQNSIRRPKIVISEWGWDRVSDVPASEYGDTEGLMTLPDIWRGWGFGDWEKYAADQLKWAWAALYKPFYEVVSVCFFCLHNQPVDPQRPTELWQNFNAFRAPRFRALTEKGFETMAAPVFKPFPPGHYRVNSNSSFRLRAEHSLISDPPLLVMTMGTQLQITAEPAYAGEGYIWQQAHVGAFTGWFAANIVPLVPIEVPVETEAQRLLREINERVARLREIVGA